MNILIFTAGVFIGLLPGFIWARMVYAPQIDKAELRGLTNRRVMELSAEDAARRVA